MQKHDEPMALMMLDDIDDPDDAGMMARWMTIDRRTMTTPMRSKP